MGFIALILNVFGPFGPLFAAKMSQSVE